MAGTLSFVIGNMYQKIPPGNAKTDRTKSYRKVHDWTLYLDVFLDPGNEGYESADIDLIDHVVFDMCHSTFRPQIFTHHSPIKVTDSHGRQRWRFATRQQTYGLINTEITVKGRGGTDATWSYHIRPRNHEIPNVLKFEEPVPSKPLGPTPIPDIKFGIELELTSAHHESPEQIGASIEYASGHYIALMTENYAQAKETYDDWKIMGDSSIICHINRPDCHKFELVSPILSGNDGIGECRDVIQALRHVQSVKVNKSMGFHVHVDVRNISRKNLIKICQQYIKYEAAIDAMMPPSRRDNDYCKSNKKAVPGSTNRERHDALQSCNSVAEVCDLMNHNQSRYYKLNLQNIRSGRQSTIEFRQHSATSSPEKILNWVRFCILFVTNSMRLQAPRPLKDSRPLEEQMDMLFQFVVKDRFLARFYKDRANQLNAKTSTGNKRRSIENNNDDAAGYCCDECAHGGNCQAEARTVRIGTVRTIRR